MKRKMLYRGYIIMPVERQGLTNFQVTGPNGIWKEVAANIPTAKKWIEADLIERNTRKPTETPTVVIFRKFKKDKDIIAIFPEEPGDNSPATCSSYQFIGQHGACDPYGLITKETVPATEQEYDGLRRELQMIGYNLKIVRSLLHKYTQNRIEKLHSIGK